MEDISCASDEAYFQHDELKLVGLAERVTWFRTGSRECRTPERSRQLREKLLQRNISGLLSTVWLLLLASTISPFTTLDDLLPPLTLLNTTCSQELGMYIVNDDRCIPILTIF